MKKIFAMMLCLFILLGCSQKDNDTANTNEINQSSEKTKDDIDDWYTRFEDNLKNKNINYKNKTNIDVSQIGAKEGYRYDGDNGSIEVYRFEDGEDFNRIVKEQKLKKDGKVQLVGFGTFEVTERAERQGRNPATGEAITIVASKSPKFKAGKALKEAVKA